MSSASDNSGELSVSIVLAHTFTGFPTSLMTNNASCFKNSYFFFSDQNCYADKVLSINDKDNTTCFSFTKENMKSSAIVYIIEDRSFVAGKDITITLTGKNLYCDIFDTTCTKVALQVFVRSYNDDASNPKCTPVCGNEILCRPQPAFRGNRRCRLQCKCPPNGCVEMVYVFNEALVSPKDTMEVCEIYTRVSD